MSNYANFSVPQLKNLLKQRNMDTRGKKQDLIMRLDDANKEVEGSGSVTAPGVSVTL
jgi:hypothetical protein